MAKDNTSMAGAFPPGAPRGAAASKSAAAAPAVAPVQQEFTAGKVVSKGAAALKRFDAAKLAVKQTGQALLHTSETLGATFIGSMAEGYLGPEKLKVGGLDVRAPIGLAAQAFGLYSIATGEKGGEHALAIGNGVSASWLASVGREAGHALRERKAPASPAPAQPAGGASFRGESPLITIPAEAEVIEGVPTPSYQGYPQLPPGPSQYPVPYHGMPYPQQYPAFPQYQQATAPMPAYAPSYAGMPSMQGNMVPVEPVQMGANPPGYPQPQMMHYAQAPGVATPGVPMPGLMPEPIPRMAGAPREIMLTPESAQAQPGRPMPQMMLTPEGPVQASFEGRYVMLTPALVHESAPPP